MTYVPCLCIPCMLTQGDRSLGLPPNPTIQPQLFFAEFQRETSRESSTVLWVEGAVWMLLFLSGNELVSPLSGSGPSSCEREYGHSCRYTPQSNGPGTVFAGSDKGRSNKIVTNPGKMSAASNQVNLGQKNDEHHWHYPPSVIRLRRIGSSFLHSGSRKHKDYPATFKNKYVPCIACPSAMQMRSLLTGDAFSAVNYGHRGNSFGSFGSEDRGIISGSMLRSIVPSTIHLGSADNRPGHRVNNQERSVNANSRSDRNDCDSNNLASSTIGPRSINFGSAHRETGHSAGSQGHRSTLLSQFGRNVDDDRDRIHPPILFGSGHSGIPRGVDDAEHGGNAHSPSESEQTASEENHDQNNVASNEISPPSTQFESPHDGIAPVLDTPAHGGNAHSESGSRQSINERNHYNHDQLAPSAIVRPTIFFGSDLSGITPGVGNADNDGNERTQYSQNGNDNSSFNQGANSDAAVHSVDNLGHRGNAHSQSSRNIYNHSSSLPSAMRPPISFGSTHSGIPPSAENAEHGRNAFSESADSANTQGHRENAYNRSNTHEHDRNSLAFGEISPPTIFLSSEREEHGNAYRQFGSRQTTNERNHDDHNSFAPTEANPPTIQFGSGNTWIYRSEDNEEHEETEHSQSGTDSDGDNSISPSANRPTTIFFGPTHSGFAPSAGNVEHSGSAYTNSGSRQSTLERNHYDHNIPAPREIHRPTIHFGSGHEGVAPDVDNAEQGENVHSQSGSEQSASEENYNNQNNLTTSETNPPMTNIESAHSGIPLSVDQSEHRDNNSVTHSHGGGPDSTLSVTDHDKLNSSSVHYEPSKITPVIIYFGDSGSFNTQNLSSLSNIESHLGNFASNQNRNDADRSDQGIFVPSAVSNLQLGSTRHSLESERGSHTPGNIVSEVDSAPTIYFGSGSDGVSPSADNQIYSEIDHSETTTNEDNSGLSASGSRVYEVISVAPTLAGQFVSSRFNFYDRISHSNTYRRTRLP